MFSGDDYCQQPYLRIGFDKRENEQQTTKYRQRQYQAKIKYEHDMLYHAIETLAIPKFYMHAAKTLERIVHMNTQRPNTRLVWRYVAAFNDIIQHCISNLPEFIENYSLELCIIEVEKLANSKLSRNSSDVQCVYKWCHDVTSTKTNEFVKQEQLKAINQYKNNINNINEQAKHKGAWLLGLVLIYAFPIAYNRAISYQKQVDIIYAQFACL